MRISVLNESIALWVFIGKGTHNHDLRIQIPLPAPGIGK